MAVEPSKEQVHFHSIHVIIDYSHLGVSSVASSGCLLAVKVSTKVVWLLKMLRLVCCTSYIALLLNLKKTLTLAVAFKGKRKSL